MAKQLKNIAKLNAYASAASNGSDAMFESGILNESGETIDPSIYDRVKGGRDTFYAGNGLGTMEITIEWESGTIFNSVTISNYTGQPVYSAAPLGANEFINVRMRLITGVYYLNLEIEYNFSVDRPGVTKKHYSGICSYGYQIPQKYWDPALWDFLEYEQP